MKHFFDRLYRFCKKLVSISFLVFFFHDLKAQNVYIPDYYFRDFLTNNFPGCMSGDSLDTTCPAILNATEIIINDVGVTDLTGVQYFTNLQTLVCTETFLELLPNLTSTLLHLDVGGNHLTSLPVLPPSLTFLACNAGQLTSIPALPASITYLECSYNLLSTLPVLPPALVTLYCHSNQLTALPSLPGTITLLNCSSNLLTFLPTLPSSIGVLNCEGNQLTTLPVLPSSLTYLNCNSNTITSWPVFPNSLTELYCARNQLTTLPTLPNSLLRLDCSHNPFISLPSTFPSTLVYLDCSHDSLQSLPSLPTSLVELLCFENQLASLPTLPAALLNLDCHSNNLDSLPAIPSSLRWLNCGFNSLTSLPYLPSIMEQIHAYHNQIMFIPNFPDWAVVIDISYNPIACLPELNVADFLDLHHTNVHCIPNYGTISDGPLELPLCRPSDGCPMISNIMGEVYVDNNNNCLRDTNELLLHGIPVRLYSGGTILQGFSTDVNGYYSFITGNGNFEIRIDTSGLPFDIVCPASFYYNSILTPTHSVDTLLNFAVQCKPGFDFSIRGVSLIGRFFPGQTMGFDQSVGDPSAGYGFHCATGIGGFVQTILSGPVTYVSPMSGALTPSSVNGDTITWNINDFALINPSTDFNFYIHIDTTTTIGDTACFQIYVSPVAGDYSPSNNYLSVCYPARNSYDPNEKYMSPSGNIDTSEQWFDFMVFFQNTGNAPAERIYILDSLSNYLDAESFTFLTSSHYVITQLLPGNVLRFNYPNINLSDSTTDEPGSHGFVSFKVKRKLNLSFGTTIANTAYINFDYNPAIKTNIVSATLTSLVGIRQITTDQLVVHPNPFHDGFTVVGFQNSTSTKRNLKLVDVLGRVVYSAITNSLPATINTSLLSPGVYILSLESEGKFMIKKIIKE